MVALGGRGDIARSRYGVSDQRHTQAALCFREWTPGTNWIGG